MGNTFGCHQIDKEESVPVPAHFARLQQESPDCPTCDGSGRQGRFFFQSPCEACSGSGKIVDTESDYQAGLVNASSDAWNRFSAYVFGSEANSSSSSSRATSTTRWRCKTKDGRAVNTIATPSASGTKTRYSLKDGERFTVTTQRRVGGILFLKLDGNKGWICSDKGRGVTCQRLQVWQCKPFDNRDVIIRSDADISRGTGQGLNYGEKFDVAAQKSVGDINYLELADGRGWVPEHIPGEGIICQRAQEDSNSVLQYIEERCSPQLAAFAVCCVFFLLAFIVLLQLSSGSSSKKTADTHWRPTKSRSTAPPCVGIVCSLTTTTMRPRPVCPPGMQHAGPGGKVESSADQVQLSLCSASNACPPSFQTSGGYFCADTNACAPASAGPLFDCTDSQCYMGDPEKKSFNPSSTPGNPTLTEEACYDLRYMKNGRVLGCAAPVSIFAGNAKYGCSGDFATAATCDAAANPIKDTQFVWVVHAGCQTQRGRGTYGYAYDDANGLKQCAPVTKYEWILCPTGTEGPIAWSSSEGKSSDSTKRFRVTNKCKETIWVQQAGGHGGLPQETEVQRIDAFSSYTYSIPNRGLASTRFLPKTGCDSSGNNCDIQSMPPCPEQGCDIPIDTKFESTWGCAYWRGDSNDTERCSSASYQDWWDGSAVDGWTLPFSVLVDDQDHSLSPFDNSGSPAICSEVVCADLDANKLCPKDEYLTPQA